MNETEPDKGESPRRYRWPWFFWGAVALFILLAVLWVGYAAVQIHGERDFNTPLPGTAPLR